MLTTIVDGAGVQKTIITSAQETIADKSGVIAQTDVAQELMPANEARSGWFVQNVSTTNGGMWINELGEDAAKTPEAGNASIFLAPGDFYPKPGQPICTAAISILGTAADGYVAREW